MGDLPALAETMLDAYRGTVDDEGEDDAAAIHELEITAEGAYGTPLGSEWLAISSAPGVFASAVLTTRVDQVPFVAFVFTRADHKGHGLASALIAQVMRQLAERGEQSVTLRLSIDNPAIRIYRRLGFKIL